MTAAIETTKARPLEQLDLYKLPGPLRLSAYLSSDWRLSSDWYSWEVNP